MELRYPIVECQRFRIIETFNGVKQQPWLVAGPISFARCALGLQRKEKEDLYRRIVPDIAGNGSPSR